MAPSAATAITIAISGAATLPTRRRRFDGGPPGWLPRPPEPPRPALPPRPARPRPVARPSSSPGMNSTSYLRPPGGTGPLAARGRRPPGPSAVRTVRLAGGAEFRLAVVAGVLAAG